MPTHDLSNPYLSIILPVYNEAARIGSTIESITGYLEKKSFQAEVIFVLNNCIDNSRSIIESAMMQDNHIKLIDLGIIADHQGNTKGLAVAAGMRSAVGDYHVFTDADLATPLFEIDRLLEIAVSGTDVVIGSRRAPGAVIDHSQIWYRVLLGRIGNALIRLMVLPGIYDTQCGCKLFTRVSSSAIFNKTTIAGWGFDIEVLALARQLSLSIKEIGVHWHDVPNSKIRPSAYSHTLRELISIFWRLRVKNNNKNPSL